MSQSQDAGLTIEPSSSLLEIQQRIGVGKDEELRESEKRRRYLQKLARLVTPTRPDVRMTATIPTAAVNQGGEITEKLKEMGAEERDEPLILMTTREFSQPVTEYSRRVYDAMMQKALLIHEVGHILYTDSEDFRPYLDRVEGAHMAMFKKIWNTLEDAAIEEQLRREYAVEYELEVLNANLMSEDEIGHRIDEDTLRFSFFQAVQLGLMDMGLYDSGLFAQLMHPENPALTFAGDEHDRSLLQEFIPEMQKVVQVVKTEPVSSKRNTVIWEFWEKLQDYLDESSVPGHKESGLENLLSSDGSIGSGDGDGDGESDESAAPMFGKPNDADSDFGGDAQDAFELGMEDVQEAIEEGIQEALGGGGAPDGDEEGDQSEPKVKEPDDGGFDEDKEEQYQQEIASEAAELDGGQARMDEAERFLDIIKEAAREAADQQRSKGGREGGPEWRGLTLDLPTQREYHQQRWLSSQRRANRLARILRNRLQWERRTEVVRNQRRGRLSTGGGSMMRVERNDFRVFERDEEHEEKDYHAIFVLDRSGSMSGAPVRDAEEAMTSMALALEKVNSRDKIQTCIMDLLSSQARLAKPFGTDIISERGNIVTPNGQSGGGTPLAQVLHLARKRVQEENTQPFMIVVTDGRPSSLDRYRNELKNATFPVLGIYITSQNAYSSGTHSEDESYFHQTVYVTDTNEIDKALMQLCQGVMF